MQWIRKNIFKNIKVNIWEWRRMRIVWILNPTQLAHDVRWTAPQGSLKVLTSGTYRGPSEDFQWTDTKVDELMKKLCFRSKSLVLHIYSCFLQEREIFKNYKLRDAVAGRPGDQMVGRSTDVRRTLVINFF